MSNRTLNIAKGDTYAETTITINNDDSANPLIALEGNESFDITLSNAVNAIFADSASSISTTVTILDDEPAPTLSFEATSNFNPAENIGNLVLNVSLSSQALLDVSFDVAVEDGTATIGEDYSNPTQNSFSIARGASKPTNSITIPITSDRDFEGNETFDLILSNLTGATFGSSATLRQTITIVDDELPVMKMSNRTATVAENIAGGMLDIDVELNGSSSNLVTFDYYISTGTGVGFATADADFTPPANGIGQGSVTIGEKTGTIQIPILNDNLDEPNETFTITLSNPRHAILSKILTELVTTVTIEDDDVPELEISAVNQITEGAVANVDFTITADIMPRNNLTIHYLPVSAGFLSPEISNKPQTTSQPLVFTAVDSSNPSNTTATATFSLPLVSDTIAEENGTVVVTLQAPSPAESTSPNYRLHATNYLTTIDLVDDDSEIPVLIVAGPTHSTAESAGSVEFTVIAYDDQTKSNSINPGRNITIQYTPEEVNPGNFLSNAGTPNTAVVNFNERDGIWTSTFAVEIDDDSSGEATGNIKVTLNDDPATISTYTVSTGDDKSAEATIWDDDAPELSIVAGPAVTEGDDVKATFKVISNVLPSTNSIPIQYTPTSATYIAGSGTPVTANPGVSFDKNDTTGKYEGTIEVDIVNDNTYEPDGSVSVTLNGESPATNYYVVSPESASVAVSDDDPIPTISVANLTPSLLENSGSVRIPVTLSNLTAETASVRWSTTHGTATA